MECEIYDLGNEEKCLVLRFDFENGMSQSFYIDDEMAKDMAKIIINKLNSRFEDFEDFTMD